MWLEVLCTVAVATDADVAAAVSFNRVAATSRVSSAAVAVAVAVAYEEAGYKGGGRRGNSKCLVVMREVR